MRWPRRTDPYLLELFGQAGRNAARAGVLVRDLITDYPERANLAREVLLCEQEGDRLVHDIIYRLNENGHGRPPFDSADVHAVATALDDIVDYAEQAADSLGLFGVEAPMEQAVALASVLVSASEAVADALSALQRGDQLTPHLLEVHRLESEGDRVTRDGVASLFANGIDPMVVIRWKDIFESLEEAVDACNKVANLLEGISLKRR